MVLKNQPKLNDAEERALVASYGDGVAGPELAARHKIHVGTVYKILRRHGCRPRTISEACGEQLKKLSVSRRGLSGELESLAIALYSGGASASSIGKRLGAKPDVVFACLRRHMVAMRAHSRLCVVREDVFDDAANCPFAAYVVGLWMADGCVYRPRDGQAVVSIGLSGNDGAHVRTLRDDFFHSTHKLTVSSAKLDAQPSTRLSICSDRLADSLARYGVLPRKTLTARVHELESNAHFWVGAVCGDGSVGFYNSGRSPKISLCGSPYLIEQFRDFVKTSVGRSYSIVAHGNIRYLHVTSIYAAALARVLFKDTPFALPRKKAVADRIIEAVR